MYAIQNGAEWIYDTDDDNKPYSFVSFSLSHRSPADLGLDQFDYEDEISGLRYHPSENCSAKMKIQCQLFNPYKFFGNQDMWPRGFPLSYFHVRLTKLFYVLQENIVRTEQVRTCQTMKRPAVQQGLVHKVRLYYRRQECRTPTSTPFIVS